MRTPTTAAITTALLLTLTACAGEPTQEEITEECIPAVKALDNIPQAHDPRPEECEGLTQDNYNLIILNETLNTE